LRLAKRLFAHRVFHIKQLYVRIAYGNFTADAVRTCERLKVRTAWNRCDVTYSYREVGRGAQPLHILVCHGAAMLLMWTGLFCFLFQDWKMTSQREGVEVVESGRAVKVHADTPHLVSLGGGRLSTAVTLHPLPQGEKHCMTLCMRCRWNKLV